MAEAGYLGETEGIGQSHRSRLGSIDGMGTMGPERPSANTIGLSWRDGPSTWAKTKRDTRDQEIAN